MGYVSDRIFSYQGKNRGNPALVWNNLFFHITRSIIPDGVVPGVLSADKLCKQFGPRSGPIVPYLDPNCLTTRQMAFLKDFLKMLILEKKPLTKSIRKITYPAHNKLI